MSTDGLTVFHPRDFWWYGMGLILQDSSVIYILSHIWNRCAMYLIQYLFLPAGLWGLLLSNIWVPCCWSGRGGLLWVFICWGFPPPSTISGSFRSLMLVLNLPSHLKPARGHKSERDHPKISVSLHKSNSFTILQHNALKYACLARSLPAAFSRIACERSGDPWELFSSDSLGQCIRTDSSLSARWWLQKKIDTPFQTDFTQTLLRGASGNPAIRSVVNKYYKIVNYKRDV